MDKQSIKAGRLGLLAEQLGVEPDTLQEYCLQAIKETIEDAKKKSLLTIKQTEGRIINKMKSLAEEVEYLRDRASTDIKELEELCKEAEQKTEKLKIVKRMANDVVNNATIDGFECNVCGCIVKNININGNWFRNVNFCPNCGGENINSPNFADRRLRRR